MRRFKVVTTSSDNDLLDLFTFHVAREQVMLLPFGEGYGFHEGAPGAPEPQVADIGYGFFDNAPGAPDSTVDTRAAEAATPAAGEAPKAAARAAAKPEKAPAAALEASTLRVSVEKVDQLINLVGELVITQAMLAQKTQGLDAALQQQLAAGLADLERNTRDLQESVMSIRMIPMSVVFNRFPRMLRDLATKLGKKVEFVTQGEATELDKGLVEKITDPLTHLVRNSCDHGIELPADRISKGKPEQGTISLIASHQGGSIVIEVRDDGRGLNREKLIKKAREKVKLIPVGPGYGFHEGAPGAPTAEELAAERAAMDPGYGFFDDAPGAPGAHASDSPAADNAAPAPAPAASVIEVPKPTAAPKAAAKADTGKAAAGLESSTLRVSVEKVDQLINLVGELVITQAMLAQNSKGVDAALYQQMASGLADLERNTRDLQESVMSIRMIPMSVVFNRFPRMLRDLAAKLGKKVEFVTQGEATELDKGLVEKITDP
ncbi:MAG TPA: hypothetical protein VL172_00215, partial [Kofleriaceae bacterium]|nr:hypothetical protein [Kofleriaceae bacterium]